MGHLGKQIRYALAAATLLAVPSTVILGSAGTADAITCRESGYFLCLYENADAGGSILRSSQTTANYDYIGNPYAIRYMNDKASSGTNSTDRTYPRVWEDDSYSGSSFCLTPGRSYPQFGSGINDKSSSHRFYSSC